MMTLPSLGLPQLVFIFVAVLIIRSIFLQGRWRPALSRS
jgi:hypothetical protein